MNTLEMRRLRQEMVQNAKSLIEAVDAEKRDLTADEEQKLTDWKAEVSRLDSQVQLREGFEQLAAEQRAAQPATKPEVQEQETQWRDAPAPTPRQKADLEYRFGQYLQGVYGVKSEKRAPTGLGELIPSDGGFLVQQDFATELLRRAYQLGQITSRCRRIPISANANSLKVYGVDETSRATGSRWGGIRAYWLAEAGALTASAPKFAKIELSLHKLGVLAYATDELLQDAAALGSVIMDAASEEIAWTTENAIINGTGAGQPLGILTAACTVSQAKESGQSATTVVAQNVINMRSRLWAASRGNSVWLVNQNVEPQLHQMSVAVGTGGVPVYLPATGLASGPYDTLYGRPVIPVEYCATLGTVGDIILADFSQYLLADKSGIQSASSIHVQFLYDETVFRFIYRVDGQPTWNSALTPANGSATLSPFVTLATRA